ncbi:MAG TPA: NAD(P)H-dependent glycerol-3-phosphate dehydrogenase [Phycisphaerales bacterium]|nr:NAD(P)H-dependent glycerol-3-phosphate dehydrogenase [Phycisphaerales bacterium]
MFKHAAIIGDGQMALVMADVLCTRGVPCRLWGPFPKNLTTLKAFRTSPRLPGFSLHESVEVETDLSLALAGCDLVISSIPTQFLRSIWLRVGPILAPEAVIVSVTKGIENQTLLRPSQIIAEHIKAHNSASPPDDRVCVLTGPTIAAELARHQPATMVAASSNQSLALAVQDSFGVFWLRVYTIEDVVGVEIAAAAKNVIALAAGMLDGLNVGYNAKSALLTRGLAEIARLGSALGAQTDTFFGIAGVGDLATTCFSPEGRNRSCGEQLGRGKSLDEILKSTSSVVEGVPTCSSICQLAEKVGVDMPIASAVHAILFEGLKPADAIRQLMQREQKPERIG